MITMIGMKNWRMNVETMVAVLLIMMLLLLLVVFVFDTARTKPKAKRRAGELLSAVLTCEQYGQLMKRNYIDIPSPSVPERSYRVPKLPGLVQVRDKGNVTMWLCLQPLGWIPDEDIVVIHKLMIEADEETYLRKARQLFPFYIDYEGWTTLMRMGRGNLS